MFIPLLHCIYIVYIVVNVLIIQYNVALHYHIYTVHTQKI